VDFKDNNEQPLCIICNESETDENQFRSTTKCEKPHGPYCTYCWAKMFKEEDEMNCPECRKSVQWNDLFPINEPRPLCLICYVNETDENHFLFTNCDQLHGPYCNQCLEKRFLEEWRSHIACPRCQIPVYSKDVFSKQQIERLQSTRRIKITKEVFRWMLDGISALMKKVIFDPKYLQHETAIIGFVVGRLDKNQGIMPEAQLLLQMVMITMWIVTWWGRLGRIGQWFAALQNPYKFVYRTVAIIAAIAFIILKTYPSGEGEFNFE